MTQCNVVLVSIDSLRADHLGCYGYGKNTSPHIDALAREGAVFECAFAPGIPTLPSFTTLLSGLHPFRHGITAHGGDGRLGRSIELMPQMAQAAGYVTIGIDNLVTQGSGRGSWFARGFDFYSSYLYQPFGNQSAKLTDRALGFIGDFAADPFFLFLHLWDPHSPYGPLSPYDEMHYTPHRDGTSPSMEQVKAIAPEYYDAFLADMRLRHADDYDWIVAQYDGEISYADAQVGRIVAQLKAQGVWDNTLLIVMSDHGECFGEGGVYFDHHGLYDATMRVALIWRMPGMEAMRPGAIISTEDILPTLLETCGWQQPASELTGRSFAPAVRGESYEGRDFIVGVEATRQASMCFRTKQWKLVQPIVENEQGRALPDIYGRPRSVAPLLFDLANDPAEACDVAQQRPEVRDMLLQRLINWRAAEVARRGGSDPLLESVKDGLSLDYEDFMARLKGRKLRG